MIIGVLVASVATSTLFIQGVGITLMMITFFVAPAVLPVGMVANVDAIKYAGYFLPFKYPISLMIESFSGFDPVDPDQFYIMNINNSSI
jgi:hypothetical protein